MSQSPENKIDELISYAIYSNEVKINDSFNVICLWVRREINKIGYAKIVLEAGNIPKQEVSKGEDETFAPGNTITIEAGYQQITKKIFEGVIISHGLEIEETQDKLIIECHEFAYPMILSRNNNVFENKKDSEIIEELILRYGLNTKVKSTSLKYNELVQYHCSDWNFMLSRANLNGMIVITEGKNIKVMPPDLSSSPLLVLTYGKDIITFKGNLQTNGQAWKSRKGSNHRLNQQGEVSRIIGEVKFQGNADAELGSIIKLAGLSKRFNGNVFISLVEHEIKEGMWSTTTGIGLSPDMINNNSEMKAPAVSSLLPGIQGMHIGKISKIDEDPDKENRLQVEIPLLNGEYNKIWARLSTFWASNQYGALFIPDIGDEVVLGFFNNDPCYPVILGSLYSRKQSPSSIIQQENNIKSIVTKSQLKIEFEDEKKSIIITTPGNNRIEISDDDKSIKLIDQNANKIEMNNSGILIESSQSLTLKAGTNIKIEAGTNIDLQGQAALNLKASTIDANANTNFTAKGNATAELSAGGQTVVKGALVMIN